VCITCLLFNGICLWVTHTYVGWVIIVYNGIQLNYYIHIRYIPNPSATTELAPCPAHMRSTTGYYPDAAAPQLRPQRFHADHTSETLPGPAHHAILGYAESPRPYNAHMEDVVGSGQGSDKGNTGRSGEGWMSCEDKQEVTKGPQGALQYFTVSFCVYSFLFSPDHKRVDRRKSEK